LINVQEASQVLKRKKPWPKKITSTVVAAVAIVIFLAIILGEDYLSDSVYVNLQSFCLITSALILLIALIWIKRILSEVVKLNIPMMVLHLTVLLYFIVQEVPNYYYSGKLNNPNIQEDPEALKKV
jgi:drug/metabolite transporter (DMT)-like permease